MGNHFIKCAKPELSADLIKSSNLAKYQLEEIEKIEFINDDMGLKSAFKEQITYNLNKFKEDFSDLDDHFICFTTSNVPEDVVYSYMYISKFRAKYQKENSLFNKRISDCYKRFADEYKLEIYWNDLSGRIYVIK